MLPEDFHFNLRDRLPDEWIAEAAYYRWENNQRRGIQSDPAQDWNQALDQMVGNFRGMLERHWEPTK